MKLSEKLINTENKQHINLSSEAIRIIEGDMANFKFDTSKKNKSGFFNIIFENYRDRFPLASSIVLKNINKIKSTLNNDGIEKRIVESIMKEFSRQFFVDTIKEYEKKFSKDFPYKFKLNKSNVEYLKRLDDLKYFKKGDRLRLGFYLKICLESYARLPKIERERVYLQKKIDIIESCILKGTKVTIKYQNGKWRDVKPIEVSDQSRIKRMKLIFNYKGKDDLSLVSDEVDIIKVGLEATNQSSAYEGMLQGFEEAVIKDMRKLTIESVNLRSVMPEIDVKVRFTKKGLDRYRDQEDEFPIIGIESEKDPKVLEFCATESEVFYYLFQFGGQAQIVEPIHLRDTFKKFYKAAYDIYERKEV
jgi:hypothetical protein